MKWIKGFITVKMVVFLAAAIIAGSGLTACATCEDERMDCIEECEDRYRASIGQRKQCSAGCNWEYRKCED